MPRKGSMKSKDGTKIGGVSANTLVIPLIVVLIVLYALITVLFYQVNLASNDLSVLMSRSGDYQDDITDLQAGASILSETATNFVLMPTNPNGELNVGQLMPYATEIASDRRGPDVLARFLTYDVSPEVIAYVNAASTCSADMLKTQIHAISLIKSVYPFPAIPALASIPTVALTEEESALPDEARLTLAKSLLLNNEYAQLRYALNQNVTASSQTLKNDFAADVADKDAHIQLMRTLLWIVIIGLTVIAIVVYFLFYHWIVSPLRGYAQSIASDKELQPHGAIGELRLVAATHMNL